MNFNDYSDDIVFGFNTRTGGVSTGVYDSMNLSLTLPDDPADVMENYEIWCRDLGVRIQDLVIGLQTHTNNVVRVDERNKGQGLFRTRMKDVDGMVTNVPGVALVTYHADCTPVYLYDPVKKAIGMVHAGWRGTVKEIAGAAVRKLQTEFGTDPADLVAMIGPCISKEYFECDRDVVDAVRAMNIPAEEMISYDTVKNKYHVSIAGVNRLVLEAAGVPGNHIDMQDRCTYGNPSLFFSHRRDGLKRGGHCALLMLR